MTLRSLIPSNSSPLRAASALSVALTIILAAGWFLVLPTRVGPSGGGGGGGAGADDPAAGGFLYHKDFHAGSTGIVDEDDIGEVVFSGHLAKIALSVAEGRAMLRYPINPHFEGESIDLSDIALIVRYTDNGDDARVIARLKRLNTDTGDLATLLTVDSNDFIQRDDPQRRSDGDTSGDIDFGSTDLWWVEVTLIKTGPAGRPEVEAVEVWARDV